MDLPDRTITDEPGTDTAADVARRRAFAFALARILSDSKLDAEEYVRNYSGGRGAE